MKTKILIILFCTVYFSSNSFGQKNEVITVEELKSKIRAYLENEKQLNFGESAILYVVSILDSQDFSGETGVYKFGVLGSHQLPYIVLVSESEIIIICDYRTSEVLRSYIDFIKKHKDFYTEYEKYLLLNKISDLLLSRIRILDSGTIPEEIYFDKKN